MLSSGRQRGEFPHQRPDLVNDRLRMFAQNIALLGGLLVCAGVSIALFVSIWIGLRVARFRLQQKQAADALHRSRTGPDGRPLPPAARGLCDRCGIPYDRVYHLPDGRRRCESCYAAEFPDGRDPRRER